MSSQGCQFNEHYELIHEIEIILAMVLFLQEKEAVIARHVYQVSVMELCKQASLPLKISFTSFVT